MSCTYITSEILPFVALLILVSVLYLDHQYISNYQEQLEEYKEGFRDGKCENCNNTEWPE